MKYDSVISVQALLCSNKVEKAGGENRGCVESGSTVKQRSYCLNFEKLVSKGAFSVLGSPKRKADSNQYFFLSTVMKYLTDLFFFCHVCNVWHKYFRYPSYHMTDDVKLITICSTTLCE